MSPNVAIVAALEREVKPAIKRWRISEREHSSRVFRFYENDRCVLVCGGIGAEAGRRAAEAIIALYNPEQIISLGFAGALEESFRVGDTFIPRIVIDAGDSSTSETGVGQGTLLSFGSVATLEQKAKLATAYSAQAVDMEAAAVARVAQLHDVRFQAVKAISDEKNFEMPDLDRFVKDGRFRATMFVAYSAVRPWRWLRVIRLAKNSARATKTLCAWLNQYNRNPEFLENVPSGLHLITKRKKT
jgi:adenosylhomocysteine nucleosidase